MKNKIVLFVGLFIAVSMFLFSCEKKSEVAEKVAENAKTETETYVYKNKEYTFEFKVLSDSSYQYLGDTTETKVTLIQSVYKKPNLSILTFSDSKITYLFDTKEEKENYLNTLYPDRKKAGNHSGLKGLKDYATYIRCYSNASWNMLIADCLDSRYNPQPYYDGSQTWMGFNSLRTAFKTNYNDVMSSIRISNCDTGNQLEVQLFENDNYGGHGWSIVIRGKINGQGGDSKYEQNYAWETEDFSRKTMYTTGSWFWKKVYTWNDNVSSIKWCWYPPVQ